MADTASSSSGIDSLLSGLLQTGLGAYGAQNGAEAQNTGIRAGIGQEQTTQSNINNLYGTQAGTGNSAMTALSGALGLSGSAPNYGTFYNMPGYQFAVNQGTQAIERAAAAGGNAYTPNTLDAVGQYVTGTASQDYNNYISQLLQTSDLGAQANQGLASSNLETGGTIAQLNQNSGNAQASGISGVSGALASGVGNLPWSSILNGASSLFSGGSGGSSGGFNTSGMSGALDGYLSNSNLFGSGNGLDTNYGSLNPDIGSTPTTGTLDLSLNGGSYSGGFNDSGYSNNTGF